MAQAGKGKSLPDSDFPVLMEWVTAAEAAEITGLTRQYMHNLAPRFKSTHRLGTRPDPSPEDPSRRTGGFLIFKRKEIEAFQKARSTQPKES